MKGTKRISWNLEKEEGEISYNTINNRHFVETGICLHLLEMCTFIERERER